MKPSASIANALKGLLVYRIVFGHLVAGLSRFVAGADLTNLVFGKLCRALFFSSGWSGVRALSTKSAERMKLIASIVRGLKIFHPVVVLDAVQVIDHEAALNRANEGFVDQSMDLQGPNFWSSRTKGKDGIAVFVSASLDKLASAARKAAKARNLIPRPSGNIRPNLFSVFVFHTERLPVCSSRVNGISNGAMGGNPAYTHAKE